VGDHGAGLQSVTGEERAAVATKLGAVLDECRDHILGSSTGRSWGKSGPGGKSDVVTDLDIWIERRIVAFVSEAYPDCSTFSEEAPFDPDSIGDPLCFVIDPIDGTAEFLIGEPSFAVSVAVVSEGRVEVGLVDFPKQGVRYEARLSEGAWRSERRLVVPDRRLLASASIAVTPRQRTNPQLSPIFRRLQGCKLIDIRPITAKLTALAVGEVDAALYLPNPGSEVAIWDYAASGFIVEEAGGVFISLADRTPIMDELPIIHRSGWLASGPAARDSLLTALDATLS
jgi:myo-inositol-1(or 4)-monophosphatase